MNLSLKEILTKILAKFSSRFYSPTDYINNLESALMAELNQRFNKPTSMLYNQEIENVIPTLHASTTISNLITSGYVNSTDPIHIIGFVVDHMEYKFASFIEWSNDPKSLDLWQRTVDYKSFLRNYKNPSSLFEANFY